jgi:ADP-ribosylglycohydrolase
MALSVVDVLEEHGGIDRDALAAQFARRYAMDRNRGYGRTAHDILHRIGLGESWRAVAPAALGGEGSCGNGAAMRVAPVGGYFADDLAGAAAHAVASAEPTHSHPEGKAGAIAVAITAAVAWQIGQGRCSRGREALFVEVLRWTPTGETRDGIRRAAEFGPDEDVQNVASAVGNGSRVLAQDTVPLCIWCAARHLDSFESALWTTVAALGDRDTTCAIVGGIVALAVGPRGIPKDWLGAREPIEGA